MSIKEAALWFSKASKYVGPNCADITQTPLLLIFTHLSEERDGLAVLKTLVDAFKSRRFNVDHVVFTTFIDRDDGKHNIGKVFSGVDLNIINDLFTIEAKTIPDPAFDSSLKSYIKFWIEEYPNCTTLSKASIDGAIQYARGVGNAAGMRTLVTGSLHLVGGALRILQPMM